MADGRSMGSGSAASDRVRHIIVSNDSTGSREWQGVNLHRVFITSSILSRFKSSCIRENAVFRIKTLPR